MNFQGRRGAACRGGVDLQVGAPREEGHFALSTAQVAQLKTHTHTYVALLLTCHNMDDSLVDAHIVAWQRVGEHQKEK